MKKYFVLIAVWAVSIASLVGGLEIYKSYQGAEFDKTAIPYIQESHPGDFEMGPRDSQGAYDP